MIARKPFSVKLRSVAEVTADFPQPQAWNRQTMSADLLVVAAGFEARVLAFPEALARAGQEPIPNILVGRYQTNPEDNEHRFTLLEPLLERLGSYIQNVDADTPELVLSAVLKLSRSQQIKRVVFDISGASSNFIFSVVGALAHVLPNVDLTVLYAEAGTYNQAFKDEDASDSPLEWPEQGVSSVWTNALFAGHHQDSAKSHIVAFPSLHLSRMARCLNFCGEAVETLAERNVVWVMPRTTHPEHQWRRERTVSVARKLLAPLGERPDGVEGLREECCIDCDVQSPSQAAAIVLDQAEKHPGRNLFVVHMGSKMQAIGVAMSMAARREMSLVYARPDKFNPKNYSGGVGALHVLEFPSFGDTIKALSGAGQMVVIRADGSEDV
jgi:hypothetical protein